MRYLLKYKGTYRILADYDFDTNDFPRDHLGNIDPSFDDYYIPCKCSKGSQIYHYGGSTLVAFITSINIGHKIYNRLNEINPNIIFDYVEYDGELEFKFKDKYMSIVAEIMNAKTFGADISPLSPRNLPKAKYEIPENDILEYKSLISKFELKEILSIFQEFDKVIIKYMKKKTGDKKFNLLADRRLNMLKGKDYIHFIGMWDEFIKFLNSKLKYSIGY